MLHRLRECQAIVEGVGYRQFEGAPRHALGCTHFGETVVLGGEIGCEDRHVIDDDADVAAGAASA